VNEKILIVDDDTDLVRGLTIRLRHAGYQVVFASDGYSALAMSRREDPDLIILDLGLPAGDGFSVLQRIRRMISSIAVTPIIVLTARDAQENETRAMAAGADAFFQKPVDNQVLLSAITEMLGNTVD